MALSIVIDVTSDFNADSLANVDISGMDWVIVQIIGSPSSAISFKHSNDAGAVTGATDGNATTAINFVTLQMTDLSSGTGVTTAAAAGLFRCGVVGRFLQLSGTSVTGVTKILVHLSKIG